MNKSLLQNWKIFNKVKLAPIGIDEPGELRDINEWAEKVWNHLCDDELKRISCHITKGKQGHNITVWTDESYVYLVQSVRSEYNTNETLIYMAPLNNDNLNDFKHIAKFVHKNIKDIIGHSKDGVKALNQMKIVDEIKHIGNA